MRRLAPLLVIAAFLVPAAAPASAEAACSWDFLRIVKRHEVSCRFAQIIVADYWGKDDRRADAWRCLSDPPGYVAGRCRHGERRFRFKPRD